MSCDCSGCDCDDYQDDSWDIYHAKLAKDLKHFYQTQQYNEILELLEREFPVELADITKLKLSK